MRDDVAFQSQQFAEGVENRRDRYSQQMQDTWAQAPNAVTRFQQAHAMAQQGVLEQQKMQLEQAQTASTLANDQLRRQQAAEELQFAQALHTTDMIDAQKRTAVAQANFEEARLAKMQQELGGKELPTSGWTEEEVDAALSMGIKGSLQGNRFIASAATKEEIAAAKQRQEARRSQRERIAQYTADQRVKAAEIAAASRMSPFSSANRNSRINELNDRANNLQELLRHETDEEEKKKLRAKLKAIEGLYEELDKEWRHDRGLPSENGAATPAGGLQSVGAQLWEAMQRARQQRK